MNIIILLNRTSNKHIIQHDVDNINLLHALQILAIADADLQTTKALEVADHTLSTATKLLLTLVKLWCPNMDEKQAAVLQSCLTPDVNSADDVVCVFLSDVFSDVSACVCDCALIYERFVTTCFTFLILLLILFTR